MSFKPIAPFYILTVFIAWLNLDLGIETCFYDGMDAYAFTWLQFLFPLYVWILIGLIIIVSHYSRMIAQSLGNNPVPTLVTLELKMGCCSSYTLQRVYVYTLVGEGVKKTPLRCVNTL